jgi:hypothetical protein
MAAGTTLAKVSPTGDIIGLGRKEAINMGGLVR